MENLGKRSAAEMNGGEDAVGHSNGEAIEMVGRSKKIARLSRTRILLTTQ